MIAIRRYAWWYLLFLGVVLVLFGIGDIALGATADTGIPLGLTGLSPAEIAAQDPVGYLLFDFMTRTQGGLLIVVGVLFATILLIPYREGRLWAWRTMWVMPAWFLATMGLYLAFGVRSDQPPPPPLVSGPLLGAIAVAVLLIDRRRFTANATAGQPALAAAAS